MEKQYANKISAEVILKSKTNQSMVDTPDMVTSEHIEQFRPDSKTVEKAKNKLQELGFEVSSFSGITLTVVGKPELFEKIFDVKLTISDIKGILVLIRPFNQIKNWSFLLLLGI